MILETELSFDNAMRPATETPGAGMSGQSADSSPLDWSKLPEDLRYLAKPATLFGHHALNSHRHQMIQEMSDAELIALATLSKHMRKPDESQRISAWLKQHQSLDSTNPEALLVRHLIELIDEFIAEL
jgi:hypothetical protein